MGLTSDDTLSALSPGDRLGPYEIVAPVGRGGMGKVYRARDPRIRRDVALKVLHQFRAPPEHVQRLVQEARAAGALNHPNILAVFDVGTEEGRPYIVSELLEGESLRERLNRGTLRLRKAVEYAIQVAHGLAAAHEKGIYHRDIKPENLFITSDGRLKILDFGLSKVDPEQDRSAHSSAPTLPLSDPGVARGTAGYMAPEQVLGDPVDHRMDIFALGAVLRVDVLQQQREELFGVQRQRVRLNGSKVFRRQRFHPLMYQVCNALRTIRVRIVERD